MNDEIMVVRTDLESFAVAIAERMSISNVMILELLMILALLLLGSLLKELFLTALASFIEEVGDRANDGESVAVVAF